jgi:hypothetical protein
MATLLWLAIGVLFALLSWLVPELAIVTPLILMGLAIVAILLPREVTGAGAKIAIGFGLFYAAIFGRFLVPDPLEASGATYLLFGGGALIAALGIAGAWRNRRRRRRQRALRAAADLLAD